MITQFKELIDLKLALANANNITHNGTHSNNGTTNLNEIMMMESLFCSGIHSRDSAVFSMISKVECLTRLNRVSTDRRVFSTPEISSKFQDYWTLITIRSSTQIAKRKKQKSHSVQLRKRGSNTKKLANKNRRRFK